MRQSFSGTSRMKTVRSVIGRFAGTSSRNAGDGIVDLVIGPRHVARERADVVESHHASRVDGALSPTSMGGEAKNTVPIRIGWIRPKVDDALVVEPVQLRSRRGCAELLNQRF